MWYIFYPYSEASLSLINVVVYMDPPPKPSFRCKTVFVSDHYVTVLYVQFGGGHCTPWSGWTQESWKIKLSVFLQSVKERKKKCACIHPVLYWQNCYPLSLPHAHTTLHNIVVPFIPCEIRGLPRGKICEFFICWQAHPFTVVGSD